MVLGEKIRGILEEYSTISHEERMTELERVTKRKKSATKRLEDLTMREDTLKSMPDVAEELISEDELGTALFLKLREMEGKTYSEFYKSSEIPPESHSILTHWIFRYQRAGFIRYEGPSDKIVLTEKGRVFEYNGRFGE